MSAPPVTGPFASPAALVGPAVTARGTAVDTHCPYCSLQCSTRGWRPRLGVADGDLPAVTSRRGQAVAPGRVSAAIRQDTVFMPFHWPGEGRANALTDPALDPASRMPEFKVCAVRVEAAGDG